MKRHAMPEIKEGGVNVTPLIDVVMCLIIFFMLVAKIGISSGIDDKIDAPTTYLGRSAIDLGNSLALNLYSKPGTDEPQILVDLKGERQKELRLQENKGGKLVHPLQEVLRDMKKERGEQFNVIINAEKGMRYAQIQLVLQECAAAQVSNLNFATKKVQVQVQG
jgi:biopolymer transport protein ExbD